VPCLKSELEGVIECDAVGKSGDSYVVGRQYMASFRATDFKSGVTPHNLDSICLKFSKETQIVRLVAFDVGSEYPQLMVLTDGFGMWINFNSPKVDANTHNRTIMEALPGSPLGSPLGQVGSPAGCSNPESVGPGPRQFPATEEPGVAPANQGVACGGGALPCEVVPAAVPGKADGTLLESEGLLVPPAALGGAGSPFSSPAAPLSKEGTADLSVEVAG